MSTLQTKTGIVVSDVRDKTRTVAVDFTEVHPKYGKRVRRQSKYHCHDETNSSKVGDTVEIVGCRPLSKTKKFRIARILKQA
jgi:small subunit ribosomal protein S17